eukprot:scaffold4924_cov27-Prasinocladus_malaysianus.AAC.1
MKRAPGRHYMKTHLMEYSPRPAGVTDIARILESRRNDESMTLLSPYTLLLAYRRKPFESIHCDRDVMKTSNLLTVWEPYSSGRHFSLHPFDLYSEYSYYNAISSEVAAGASCNHGRDRASRAGD